MRGRTGEWGTEGVDTADDPDRRDGIDGIDGIDGMAIDEGSLLFSLVGFDAASVSGQLTSLLSTISLRKLAR